MGTILGLVPRIYGFLKRYRFKDLETSMDTLRSDQAWCKARGKQLLPMIEDRTYDGSIAVPSDIPYAATDNGYCAIRWDPLYIQRYLALVQKINGPIVTQESALGISDADLTSYGYTPAKLVQYYLSVLRTAPRTVYWTFNFIARDQSRIGDILQGGSLKLVAGGPDCWPTNDALVQRAYPYYSTYDPMFVGISRPSYSQPGYTLEQVYQYAVSQLRVREVFWNYYPDLFDQAIPIINDAI